MKKSFKVTGMSCANCVANVEKAVRKINGIEEVNVNLVEELMLVSFDENKTDTLAIEEAVRKAGYGAELIGGETKKETKTTPEKDYKIYGLIASVILIIIKNKRAYSVGRAMCQDLYRIRKSSVFYSHLKTSQIVTSQCRMPTNILSRTVIDEKSGNLWHHV